MNEQTISLNTFFPRQPHISEEPLPASRQRVPQQLVVEDDVIPTVLLSQDSISHSVGLGLRQVILHLPVELAEPDRAFCFLKLIRDLTACRVHVIWALQTEGQSLASLVSLYPPTTFNGNPQQLSDWQQSFFYGSLYWRAGPNFILIRDTRFGPVQLFTLEESIYLDAVRWGQLGADFSAADPTVQLAFSAESLTFPLGQQALFLPYRMRHWPIPFNSI